MPVWFLLCDQERQLERLDEADDADLPRGRLGDEQVVVLERSLEDGARVALRGRRSSAPGPSGNLEPTTSWRFAFASSERRSHMADPAPIGSDVSAGTYRCTNCGNEIPLLALLLDHREAGFFLKYPLADPLVARDHHESLWVRPHRFVFLTREPDDPHAAVILALAEIGRPLLADAELGSLRLECLVRKPEGRLVFRSSLDRSAHRRKLPVKAREKPGFASSLSIAENACPWMRRGMSGARVTRRSSAKSMSGSKS